MKIGDAKKSGFTLIELLVTIGIIAILAGMLMPALARAKSKANGVKCLNNIRQMGMAATMYAGDFADELPRRRQTEDSWILALRPYYSDQKLLKCPSDRWLEYRSYIINGFNDYWQKHLAAEDYNKMLAWEYAHGMKLSRVPLPSETVLFGEKKIGSFHVHMDFGQGQGNDKEEVNQNMHRAGGAKSGGSNFTFVDGSARFLKFGASVAPVNLWALTDEWRNAPVQIQ